MDIVYICRMTLHEAQQQLLFRLYDIYDDREAQSITDWVMEHITEWPKIDRIMNKKVPLSVPQQEALEDIAKQLLQHRPVHYILHQAWFRGMKLYVDENVLIPRPETEELVEWALKELSGNRKELTILDVGTGSGCIPISIKKKIPQASIYACDISEGALAVAARNAQDQNAAIQFIQLDFLNLDAREALPTCDVILSNPPYISEQEKSMIDKHVLEYEPHTALFVPDDNDLLFYEHLSAFGKTHLLPGGFMMMEIHYAKAEAVQRLFESHQYKVEIKKDMQGNDRIVKVWGL